jgi:hypothetical protein
MFLSKWSKIFLYAIGDILKLYTCPLIENYVRIIFIITHLQKLNTVSLTDSLKNYDQLINSKKCQLTGH